MTALNNTFQRKVIFRISNNIIVSTEEKGASLISLTCVTREQNVNDLYYETGARTITIFPDKSGTIKCIILEA